MTALVTIGIPTFNREALLRVAVASALSQDHPAVEVVVSDNASTDGTRAFCEALAVREPRFRYVRQEQNRGATANFMAVLAEAGGKYFMWLTDDDLLDTNYVSECVEVLESEPSFSLVAGRARLVGDHGRVEDDVTITLDAEDAGSRVRDYYRRVGRNSVFFGVGRTSTLQAQPGLADVLGGDWLLVAATVFGGKVRTVETSTVTRSSVGMSEDLRAAARSLGLGPFARLVPRASLALTIGRDLLRSPSYSSLTRWERTRLAASCSTSIAWRQGIRFHLARTARGITRRFGNQVSGAQS